MKATPLFIFIAMAALPHYLWSQNCNAFLFYGDTLQYEACLIAEERAGHYQFSREYQEALDRAIEKCDYFSYAYRHKSVAYLKSGDFLTWKKLIDKAVELYPEDNLGYRGWCRYQFFRDYQGAIDDIERLDSMVNHDIGSSANGDYHLHIARAICYKALGQSEKAIRIIEEQLQQPDHVPGLYDYFHLGVLYLETGKYDLALAAFQKQSEANELADNLYYQAMTYKALGQKDQYRQSLTRAKELYLNGQKVMDHYTTPYDKIYLEDIEQALN